MLTRPVNTAYLIAWVVVLILVALGLQMNARAQEDGRAKLQPYIPVHVGDVTYMVQKEHGKVMGYDLAGTGGCLRLFLFGEGAEAPGGRGSYQTALVKGVAAVRVTKNTSEEAEMQARLRIVNTYDVSISTRGSGHARWQTVQHWRRVEGSGRSKITILTYVDVAIQNKNVLLYDPLRPSAPQAMRIARKEPPASASAGSRILVPSAGACVTLSVDKPFSTEGFFYGAELCGFLISFEFGEENEFKFTIDHEGQDAFLRKIGSTSVAVDKRDLTAQIWAGPYPVVNRLFLAAGEASQRATPTQTAPSWSGEEKTSRRGWRVIGRGKLHGDWEEEIAINGDEKDVACRVAYRAKERARGDESASICVELPDRVAGHSVETTAGGKTAGSSPDGAPYRVGAVMKMGEIEKRAAIRIKIEPLRELVLVPQQDVQLELGKTPDSSPKLTMTPRGQKPEIAVEMRYVHVAAERDAEPSSFVAPPSARGLDVHENKPGPGDLTIASPYWCVVHGASNGSGLSSVRFYHGSGRELLLDSDETSVTLEGTAYSSRFCKSAVEVRREARDVVRVAVSGVLTSAQGTTKGVHFVNSYEYHPWYVVRKCVISAEGASVHLTELQVARLSLSPSLDECFYRPSGYDSISYERVIFPGPEVFNLRNGWEYIGLFKRGVEGVEIFPRSDLTQWEEQVFTPGGRTRYAVTGNSRGGATILIQPYSYTEAVAVKPVLTYDFYIGLPPIKKHPGRPVMGAATSMGGFKAMSEIVAARPEIIMYVGGGPQAKQVPAEAITQEINQFKAAGIKTIPYTWFIIPPSDAEEKKRSEEDAWYMMPAPNSKAPWRMCYDSAAYREWLKAAQEVMWKRVPFDGVYYDWMGAFTCHNSRHGPEKHYNMDGLIDLMSWTRERLGETGVVIGHCSTLPCATVEGFTTATVTLEDLYHGVKLPTIYDVQAGLEFMGATPRVVCSGIVGRFQTEFYPDESDFLTRVLPVCQELITKCFLWGYFTYMGTDPKKPIPAEEPERWALLRQLRTLKQIDFSGYAFRGFRRQTAVEVDNDFAKASVFFGDREAVVIIGNPESRDPQVVNFKVDCRAFRWKKSSPASIEEISFARTQHDRLGSRGGRIVLAGHDFRVYRLQRR